MKAFGKTVVTTVLLATSISASASRLNPNRMQESQILSAEYFPQVQALDVRGFGLNTETRDMLEIEILTESLESVGYVDPEGCDFRPRHRGFMCDVSDINILNNRYYRVRFFNTDDTGEIFYSAEEEFVVGNPECDGPGCPEQGN